MHGTVFADTVFADTAERCVRAVQSKDARFDGWFFTAVLTTGIYCRPSCPATTPKPQNMRFFPSAAAAQQAGFAPASGAGRTRALARRCGTSEPTSSHGR